MRLFTAIDLPAPVAARLDGLIARLRPLARLRWSPVENMHITTKFIGDWPDGRLEELCGVLRQVPPRPPIEIAVRGLGWFPNPHAPRVFWAAIRAPETLERLARETEDAAARLGVAVENRPFAPHLTLARVRQPVDLGALRREVAAIGDQDFGSFTVSSFRLYLSEMGPGGSRYTALRDFSF